MSNLHRRAVLLVCEATEVAEALGFWLESSGFLHVRPQHQIAGVVQAARALPSDSVVLIDFVSPQASAQLVRQLRADPGARDLAIVLMTTHPAFLVPRLDVERLLEKPVPLDELEDALVRAARRRCADFEEAAAQAF